MPAKTNKRVFGASFPDPGVQPDAGNCVRNALQRAGGGQHTKSGTICIHPSQLLRCFELLRGEKPANLVSLRAAKNILNAHPQPLAQLLMCVYALYRAVSSLRGAATRGAATHYTSGRYNMGLDSFWAALWHRR